MKWMDARVGWEVACMRWHWMAGIGGHWAADASTFTERSRQKKTKSLQEISTSFLAVVEIIGNIISKIKVTFASYARHPHPPAKPERKTTPPSHTSQNSNRAAQPVI